MQLKYFAKIEPVNDVVKYKFRQHPQADRMDWAVTEFIDGDHLALYVDHAKNEFKVATRNRFLEEDDNYSNYKSIVKMYKGWALEFSRIQKTSAIIYGKIVGGHYGKEKKELSIKTVCDYLPYNDFIIHDIRFPAGFIAVHELEKIADENILTVAPTLYHGDFTRCICYPENGLSAIPFVKELPVNFKNEMKGIVIKPLYDLNLGTQRVIMKKLNRTYVGKVPDISVKPELSAPLIEIAAYMNNEATKLNILDAIIVAKGGFDYKDVKKMAGRYVLSTLDNVNYIKYRMLDKTGKHLVNKELNRIAEEKIIGIVRLGNAA